MLRTYLSLAVVGILVLLAGCDTVDQVENFNNNEDALSSLSKSNNTRGISGRNVVFTMTNAADGNEILLYNRASDGSLSEAKRFDTGGQGTGQSIIGSQDGIELSNDGRFLFAVNAGSNEISVFRVLRNGLTRTDIQESGGQTPVSVSFNNNLLYVLNLDDNNTGSITGFKFNKGELTPIDGSTRQLSEDIKGDENHKPDLPAAPVQVEFSPKGNLLAVTERFSGPEDKGRILTFNVQGDMPSNTFNVKPATGQSPFGMEFSPTNNNLLAVSQSFIKTPGNPVPNASVLSSFTANSNGSLTTVVGAAPTDETVACWVQFTKNGRFVYTTNTAGISNSITGFAVDPQGNLSRLPTIEEGNEGITANTGPGPVGMGISRNGKFLYAINSGGRQGQASLSAYRVNSDGSLTPLGNAENGVIVDSLPVGTFGIAVL